MVLNFFSRPKINSGRKSLLLIRLDTIGDYVIFRNFIEILKKSEKYTDFSITLCGNIIFKELAEGLDSGLIDRFVYIDKKKFLKSGAYKFQKLKEIHKQDYETLLHPTYSREFYFGDYITKKTPAKEKIGSECDLSNIEHDMKPVADKYYTRLIPAKKEILFEFYRNREFFETLLGTKLDITKPFINTESIVTKLTPLKKYVVIFPGAGAKFRQWDTAKFAAVADYIYSKYGYEILLTGSKNDGKIAREIISKTKCAKIANVCGKIKLPELAKIISKSEFLIAGDTGAYHIGVAVNAKVICISNGNHFGRFVPYPKEIYDRVLYIYPDAITEKLDDYDYLISQYGFGSKLDINNIRAEDVFNLVDKIITIPEKIEDENEFSCGNCEKALS